MTPRWYSPTGPRSCGTPIKTLGDAPGPAVDPQQQREIQELQQRVVILTNQLNETSQRLAEALKQSNGRERLRR